jgi:hypothetical protein
VYTVYDQGTDQLNLGNDDYYATTAKPSFNITRQAQENIQVAFSYVGAFFSPLLLQYYIVFFTIFGSAIYLYIRRRKTMRRFLSKVVKNIVEVRGALLDDPTNKDIFSEVWFEIPEKNVRTITI